MSQLPFAHQNRSTSWAYLSLLLIGALLSGGYVLLRYEGWTADGDTAAFSRITRAMLDTRVLIPKGAENVYPNGYGYQSLLVFLTYLTGLNITSLQTIAAPLLTAWLVIPAWMVYREFTGSRRAATLAVAILLIQPEFLFPVLRGTHEKFTRGLMFICLYLMLRSLRERPSPSTSKTLSTFAAFIPPFYLAGAALITYNNFMASSFIFAFGLSMFLCWAALGWSSRPNPAQRQTLQRLMLIIVSLFIITFVFTFFAYPPAQHQLRIMDSLFDRISALLLQVEDTATNPYAVINLGWNSPAVYLALSLANWLLLGSSTLIWLVQSWQIFRRHEDLEERRVLLWAFFGAFAAQGALSILVDVSGAIAGNLQYRMFASFVMFATPLTARWLVDLRLTSRLGRGFIRLALFLALAALGVLSLLKATTEPLLGNLWLFYRPSELQALKWFTTHAENDFIWTDYSDRLSAAYQIQLNLPPNGNTLDVFTPKTYTSTFLVSEVSRLRNMRLGFPLNIQFDSLQIYHNGETMLYHRRPLTAFQK
jgi:hypothetical protein